MLLFPYKCLGNDIFEGPQPVDHPGFIIYPGTRTGLAGGGAPNTNLRPVRICDRAAEMWQRLGGFGISVKAGWQKAVLYC
jgi:hypothetical protein